MWQRLIFCILLVGCQENEPNVFNAPKHSILQLSATSVISQKVPRFYSATGYTYAHRIKISSHQSGTIKKRLVDEGDVVKSGALLVVIDDAELLDTIEQSKSVVKSATISLKDSQKEVKLAEKLRKVVSVEHLRKSRVRLDLARSKLVQAKAELRRQQTKKTYYRLTSPISARVVKRWIEPGDLAIAGKPLLELEAIGELEFETALPAHWIKQINLHEQVKLKLHHSNATIVVRVSHIVRSANRMTQTCQIKLSLPKKTTLTAGLSGQVNFKIAENKHLLIPKSTLIKRAGVQGVFRLDKLNNAWFTPVKTERLWEQQWIVLSGLQVGERLVLQPPLSLRDGVGVKNM